MTARAAALELAARRTVFRQTLVPGCALLACLLVAAHAPTGLRAPVVIAFLCVVPGAALVGLLHPDSLELELALAIALSVALSVLTAAVLIYTHLWSPTAVVLIAAAVSLAGGLRDVGLGVRVRRSARCLLDLLRAGLPRAWHGAREGLPTAGAAAVRLAHRVARGLASVVAAALVLVRRTVVGMMAAVVAAARLVHRVVGGLSSAALALLGRVAVGLVVAAAAVVALARRAKVRRRARRVAAVPPSARAGRRARRRRVTARPAPQSSLQRFLLDELQRKRGSNGSRRRSRSLADLDPDELADLLSGPALQRFVTHRAVQQVNPELWFVDDLERLLRKQAVGSHGGRRAQRTPRVPRGVSITGVSARTSVPLSWRVLEEDGKSKEWRTRLAVEEIDSLLELGPGGAVVAAGTPHGSLSGFRSSLEARGLAYLVRVNAVTAARELAPDRPTGSAAEARKIVRRRIAAGGAIPIAPVPNDAAAKALMLVQGVERQVLCDVSTAGKPSTFWLSNLPAGTAPERLAFLVGLADRHRVERRTAHFLVGGLAAWGEGDAELQHLLAAVALAQGLGTRDLSAAPAERAISP